MLCVCLCYRKSPKPLIENTAGRILKVQAGQTLIADLEVNILLWNLAGNKVSEVLFNHRV